MTGTVGEILTSFERTTEEYVSREELVELLASSRLLRIKYGVDVTAPHLHIGHAVNLWMMRHLQDLGHTVIFLIGDFTTRIGDPTGRNRLRPIMPEAEIAVNAKEFIRQARMVLRFEPEVLEIRRNSEWYDWMPATQLIELLSMLTHARLVSRDMFGARIERGEDLYMHEMLYPILQGYDSVAVESDLTIIGSDQLFNEMLGRFYQERFGQQPQAIITTTITRGIDGKAKQSKSLGNYIGLGHSPRDKFGRTMRIPDNLIIDYLTIYTDIPLEQIEAIRERVVREPMEAKLFLARELVRRYHGIDVADQEERWFRDTFSARRLPTDIPEKAIEGSRHSAFDLVRGCLGPETSNNELRRLFVQDAIRLNGETIDRPEEMILVRDGDVMQVGKRFWLRLRLTVP